MPELRPRPRHAARPVRRLRLVLALSGLPVQAAEARDTHRREVPDGRNPRAARALRPVLWLLELPRVRQELSRTPGAEGLPELQRAVPSRAGPQGGPVLRLRDGGLRSRRSGRRSRPLRTRNAHSQGSPRGRHRRGAHAGARERPEEARVARASRGVRPGRSRHAPREGSGCLESGEAEGAEALTGTTYTSISPRIMRTALPSTRTPDGRPPSRRTVTSSSDGRPISTPWSIVNRPRASATPPGSAPWSAR